MENRKSLDVFQRDLSKGFIPSSISEAVRQETVELIGCLLRIEDNLKVLPPGVHQLILSNQLNYSDMFMKSMLQDQKKNNTLSLYPKGWFSREERKFDQKVFVDDESDFACYTEHPFSLTLFEIDSVPLLKFKTVSCYVVFML